MKNPNADIDARESRKRSIFILKVLIFILLAVFFDQITESLEEWVSFIRNILIAVIFFIGWNIVISLARIIIVRLYLRKKGFDPMRSNFVLGINRIAEILNTGAVFISLILLFGKNPVEFFTSITIVAAAIAIVTKDYITNMINGLIIMFSDQFTLGDTIKIGEYEGKITDVTLLNMVLVNEDSDLVMIPNNTLLTSQAINHSKQHVRKLTFEFEMKIVPGLDVNEIEEQLRLVTLGFEQYINTESFYLKTMAINKDGVRFKCQFLMNTYVKGLEKKISRSINQKIIEIAREN